MTTKISPYKTISNQNGSMSGAYGPSRHTTYDTWKQSWNGNRFPPPPADCVLYLPGLPGTGSVIKDYSGQDNDGTITGATWTRLPSGLWGLSFNGSGNKVTITSAASLNFDNGGDFTWEAWVSLTQYPPDKGAHENLLYKSGLYDITFRTEGVGYGVIAFAFNDNGTLYYFGKRIEFDLLTPVHLVCTKTNLTSAIYVNGEVPTAHNSGNYAQPQSTTTNLVIGYSTGSLYLYGQVYKKTLHKGYAMPQATALSNYQQERHLFGV